MKTNDLILLGLLGVGAYFLFSAKTIKAEETSVPSGATIQGSGGVVTPTQGFKTDVAYTETPKALRTPVSSMTYTSPAIQITEGGKSYIAPYRMVEVGTGTSKTAGISFGSGKYTAVSSGFLGKMKSIGIA